MAFFDKLMGKKNKKKAKAKNKAPSEDAMLLPTWDVSDSASVIARTI